MECTSDALSRWNIKRKKGLSSYYEQKRGQIQGKDKPLCLEEVHSIIKAEENRIVVIIDQQTVV